MRRLVTQEVQVPEQAKAAAAEMDLSYRMQRWPRVLYKQEAETAGLLQEATKAREEGTWPAMCRELFGRLYGIGIDKLDEPRGGCEWSEELHREADAIPEWQALQSRVRGDAWRAGVGAGQVGQILASRMPELPEENADALEAEAEMLRDLMSGGSGGKRRVNQQLLQQRGDLQKRIAKARETSAKAVEQMQQNMGQAVRSAIREAASKAKEVLDEIDDGMLGLGCGNEVSPMERRALAARLASDERLRKIANLAGRLRIQAARKQRTKTNRQPEEVKSIKQGDDVSRLLASEVGLLCQEATKPLLLQRIVDKRALVYELSGQDTKTRGPIVFCIDNSSSMRGDKDVWSKACALAMTEVARIQKRPIAILIFNAAVPDDQQYYLEPGFTLQQVLDVLGVTPSGGTRIGAALDLAEEIIKGTHACGWPYGKDSDVVVVTDGEDGETEYKRHGNALHGLGASIYTIGVMTSLEEDGIKSISDDVVMMNGGELRSANSKLDGVFSI